MSLPTRRSFLQRLACGAGAVATAPLLGGSLRAIEPIKRDFGPKFKFSLAAYSYRELLTGASPKLTLDDFIRDCAKIGLEGTELTGYYFPKAITPDYLHHIKQLTFALGLDISGTAVGNDFCTTGEKREKEIASVKRWIDHAEMMGAPVIRIFSGKPQPGQTEAQAHKLAVEGIEECCDYAGKHGVMLALENHGGLTQKPEGILALVHDVKSPWFGVNLDSGNFHGSDVYADLAQIAPYAVNVQVKVSITPAGGKRQKSDFRKLAKVLRDSGYRGYIVLEHEEKEDPRTTCPQYIAELREAFAA